MCYNNNMYLAIDVGGTKTLIALFSEYGRCLKKTKFFTPFSPSDFSTQLTSALLPYQKKSIKKIIVAFPAIIKKGGLVSPENLPAWRNYDISPILDDLFNCPVFILNDADLATLYESSFHRGLSIYLTFSTGIGGGIAKDGILTPESATFEPGHQSYPFNDTPTEWEDLASASAINRLFNMPVTSLFVRAEFETVAYRMSLGLTDIIKKYHPDTIIIGGPLAKILPSLRPFLLEYLSTFITDKTSVNIIPARRPEHSVIYGCYLYAKSH